MESKICLQCGQPYSGRGLMFCSNSCRMTWRNLRDNPAKRPEVRAKIAQQAKDSGRQSQLMTPEARQKAIVGISAASAGRTLSEAHKRAIGAGVKRAGNIPPRNPHLTGPRHPNWIAGQSTIRSKDLHSPEYVTFRDTVLQRDNWTCQRCGKRGGRLEVHHIESWNSHPELRHSPENGVTLCRPCHLAEHRGRPRPEGAGPRRLADLLSSRDES